MRAARSACFAAGVALATAGGCGPGGDSGEGDGDDHSGDHTAVDTTAVTDPYPVEVRVTVDGVAVEGVTVMQGGAHALWTTDADGMATVTMDPSVPGDQYVVASHPECRIGGEEVFDPPDDVVEIALTRFSTVDNEAYQYRDPGPESHEGTTTEQCSHCHITIHHEWFESPHRAAASNPAVHDVYQGISVSVARDDCDGTWGMAVEPGTGADLPACRVAEPVSSTGTNGACADCHAPGIDGVRGGRDLLDAEGIAFDAGVHCDVCHHVESVSVGAAAGVAGWLNILRPSDASANPVFGEWAPLTFGPYLDVLNPNMGSVWREGFHEAEFCGGCHQLEQGELAGAIDRARWPGGTLPVHTTYGEWVASPMNPSAPCQSCHMPPKPEVGNSSDLYNEVDIEPGVAGGWERPPGEVRAHTWWGPRQPEGGMLALAGTVSVASAVEGEALRVGVTVTNSGPGHALPTGEPLRNLVLAVSATCDGEPLTFTGGDVVPLFGGAVATQRTPSTFSHWTAAEPGMVIRFLVQDGWYDYEGYGPFGDGSFDDAAKGLPRWRRLAEAEVLAVASDGAVTLDTDVPDGAEVAVLGVDRWPVDGEVSAALAGAPGFAFARVLVDASGNEMVPHHLAVDVQSDNRLLPSQSWSSEHVFATTCADPEVSAVLVHRPYPYTVARTYGWTLQDAVIDEARR